MAENEKLLEGLQKIVTELAQQEDCHFIQSRIFKAQGLTKLADKYLEHANEEREYIEKCIDRLLDFGCDVKNGTKQESPTYKDAVEWIKYDFQVSKDGLNWLKELVVLAKDDLKTYDMLKEYYIDEEEDMYWAEQQLELIEKIGLTNWYATLL